MNTPFTLFNKATGQVLCGGTSDNPQSLENGFNGVLVGVVYTDGWLDEYGNHHTIGDQPGPWHVFDYAAKHWVDSRTSSEAWVTVRHERDRRLLASDWTQLPDVPIATKEAWAVYRQALRDITLQSDPFNIVWPSLPT